MLHENHCAVMSSKLKYGWKSYLCESGLPFVCKKYLNKIEQETMDTWKYYATRCDAGWYPYNRYCYRLHKEAKSWNDALISCQSDSSGLISISSMADAELLHNLLQRENITETWIGLYSSNISVVFEWSDGTPVKFSYWHSQEPNTFQRAGQLCVSAQGPEGHWKVKKCEDKISTFVKRQENLTVFLLMQNRVVQRDGKDMVDIVTKSTVPLEVLNMLPVVISAHRHLYQ